MSGGGDSLTHPPNKNPLSTHAPSNHNEKRRRQGGGAAAAAGEALCSQDEKKGPLASL